MRRALFSGERAIRKERPTASSPHISLSQQVARNRTGDPKQPGPSVRESLPLSTPGILDEERKVRVHDRGTPEKERRITEPINIPVQHIAIKNRSLGMRLGECLGKLIAFTLEVNPQRFVHETRFVLPGYSVQRDPFENKFFPSNFRKGESAVNICSTQNPLFLSNLMPVVHFQEVGIRWVKRIFPANEVTGLILAKATHPTEALPLVFGNRVPMKQKPFQCRWQEGVVRVSREKEPP